MQEVPFEVTLESRLITNPGLVLREEDDGAALLYDPETGAVRILNGSAVAIWKLLDGKRSLAGVVAALREIYDGVDEQAEGQDPWFELPICRFAGRIGAGCGRRGGFRGRCWRGLIPPTGGQQEQGSKGN